MRQEILQVLSSAEEREVAAHILDLIDRVEARDTIEASWFLSLSEQDLVSQILRRFPQLSYLWDGGFPNAERKRLLMGPPHVDFSESKSIGAVRITVKKGPEGDVSHRDLLGAVMALGFNRRYLGDVIVTDTGGEIIAVSQLLDEIVRRLDSVGPYPAKADQIELAELSEGVQRKKLIKATVPSLRLDAIASAGFGKSRSSMVREIKSLRVRINGSPAKSPAQGVKEGDIVSIQGKGRVVLVSIGGQTRKDRTYVEIERYY